MLTDPNTTRITTFISVYSAMEQVSPVLGPLPDQDVDGDGFPDPGQEPLFVLPETHVMRRAFPLQIERHDRYRLWSVIRSGSSMKQR